MLMRVEDLVILYSGGADSTLLLRMAESMGKKPFALMIDYGQLHIKELEFAKKYVESRNIANMTIKISGFDVNSALTGSGEKGLYQGVDIHNVPARNSIMLSIAAGIAESKKISEVWIGCNWEDREHLFPDCYQEYLFNLNKVFEIAFSYPIKVYAPLLGMQKYMIKDLFSIFNIKEDEIYSGYGEFK